MNNMNPLTLLIKPAAGLCNMNCSYCFYRSASAARENRIMTNDTVDVLIQRIKAYQPSALSVMFQGGEPTLAGIDYYQYFIDRVQENLSVPVQYALQTNGLLIDEAYAAFFQKYGFLIGLSLDGNRKTNDRYRRDRNGSSVLPQILHAAAILKKHPVNYNILSVIDDENANDIVSTWNYFKKHGFDYLQFIPYVDEGNGVSLSAEAYGTFLKKVFDLWYADYRNGNYISVRHIDNYIGILLGRPPENCAMCGVCGSYYVVEANGDLYPCDFYCQDAYRVGSLYDERPFAIGEMHQAFIEESRLIHSHCRDCEYHFICRGGCKKDRCNGFSENKYCKAYQDFFAYAGERMMRIAALLDEKQGSVV